MTALSFRSKLMLAMMGLVAGVTATTLLILENQARASYARHSQQSFELQIASFMQQRESRLAPVKERDAAAATSSRLIAAMENAGQAGADQQDIDDLYRNGIDQVLEVLNASRGNSASPTPGFFFFLNSKGEVLHPSAGVKLPFSFPGLRRLTQQLEAVGRAVSRNGVQQVGYLAPEGALGAMELREMVFTPVGGPASQQKLGVLAVGFPLAETEPKNFRSNGHPASGGGNSGSEAGGIALPSAGSDILSGIWLDARLFSSSIPAGPLAQLEKDIGVDVEAGRPVRNNFRVKIGEVPYQVYCQGINPGSPFPPAYQLCLYSLAEAGAEQQVFRRRILLSGTIALLGALALSLLISRSLAVPLQELVRGTKEIESGNYGVQVPIHSRDEIGHLALAFNDMAQRIQASRVALEQRIAERTQELAERKKAEAALRQSEASLREAQRIAHVGNWSWNILTNELRWSDEIFSIFGLAVQQFKATYEGFLERVHPGDREKVMEAVRAALELGKPYGLEHRVLRPDGEVRIVYERAEILRDRSGKAVGMVGTVQDITEQKRIEAEFLRAQRMDSIGALAGGIAHDLNNALSPILMGIQLIRRQLLDPASQQMLAVMEASTNRGAEMVRQVLTFARGREGERELLDIGRLIREMEHIVRQTLPKTITVAAMVPGDLWPVMGNATQLHQVLLNLCINARDAMPEGGQLTLAADNVELSADEAKGIPNAKPGPWVLLLVSDTGTGIAPEVLPRIFEPFFTTKAPGEGTGLGLSTIARIVRNHEGFVSVKSELGAGTSFEIYCPRAERAPARAPTDAALPAGLLPGQGRLILFVDDDQSVREMVVPTLTEHGYRVLSAGNGAEGLALLSHHQRDVCLILTDLAMPVMDGTAMLEALRAQLPDLPVILMSGEVESDEGVLPLGATAFLRKPFRLEQLLTAIADALKPKAV
jgi:PAS domain S-box-containing protein